MNGRSSAARFVALSLIVGAGLGAAISISTHKSSIGGPASQTTSAMNRPAAQVCGAGDAPLGFIAYLRPGQLATSLATEGFAVSSLVTDASIPPTVLIGPPTVEASNGSSLRITSPVPTDTLRYGIVYPRAAEPDLLSCDYQLSDRPATGPYVTAAETELTAHGMISATQLQSDPAFFISDDPLDATCIVLTVRVLGPALESPRPGTPSGVTILSTQSYAAIERKQSAAVIAYGSTPW